VSGHTIKKVVQLITGMGVFYHTLSLFGQQIVHHDRRNNNDDPLATATAAISRTADFMDNCLCVLSSIYFLATPVRLAASATAAATAGPTLWSNALGMM
jgi:hypothetical protein